MTSTVFIKPENALKRAEELIAVGQKSAALNTLHDVLTSKRHRSTTWQKPLEQLMLKYIELCVEMRKGKLAKDGLHQYRVICQMANHSIESVIRFFLEQAEEHAKEAQSKAEQTCLDIEDLEADETPEEETKERTDREIVTPWLKFLWETYRIVLEILRNNSKLESLYKDTALQAFNFCLKYKRKIEFRRLSEILRNHLSQLTKNLGQPQSTFLSTPESLQLQLEIRFAQLTVATELDLGQESFKTIEDVHGLMTIAKKPPKPQSMLTYYQKLSQIFWNSGNFLFHAYTSYKHYNLLKVCKPNLPVDEIKMISSLVLLSGLAIPIQSGKEEDQFFDFDLQKEKNVRMASLLGFNINPKRSLLLSELNSKNINNYVYPELANLYHLLEEKFHPLELCNSVKPKLEFIGNHPALQKYLKPLEKLVFLRFLQQLSRVYQTMKLSNVSSIVTFLNKFEIEKLVVEAIKSKLIDARLDHQNGAINFGSQVLESDSLRNQLSNLARNLQGAVEIIHPELKTDRHTKKAEAFKHILQMVDEEHKKVLSRKAVIEREKQRLELLAQKKIQAIELENLRVEKEREEKKQELLKQEAAKREAEKKAQLEQEKAKAAELAIKELAEATKAKASVAVLRKLESKIADLQDKPEIKSQLSVLSNSKKELEKKLQKQAKKLDHLERARREEEAPLLLKQIDEQKVKDEEIYKQELSKLLDEQKKHHAEQLEEKKRFSRMQDLRKSFEQRLQQKIDHERSKKEAEREEILKVLRVKMNKERQERERIEAERRAEEERRRIKEEEERRKRQEEEERRLKEEERKKKEEAERIAKLNEKAELQRKREEEVLQKLQKEESSRNEKSKREEPWQSKAEDEWSRHEEPWSSKRREGREPRRFEDSRRGDEQSWRRDDREPRRGDEQSWRKDDREPRREDSRRGDEQSWRKDDREPRRDEPRRDDREPRRDEGRRSDEQSWRRDEGRRSDESSWRNREPRRDEPRRDDREPRRFEDSRRGDEQSWRRDDREPRRDEGRRDEPRRGDREPRREDSRRGDEQSWRKDDREPRRDEPRREEPRRSDEQSWRKDDREPRRDEGRREDREPRRDEPRRDEGRRDEPRKSDEQSWKNKDNREAKRYDDNWGPNESKRGDDRKRPEDVKREDSGRWESKGDREPRRDERRRDDREPRRDEPRRDEGRRDEPRRDERRRDEPRRDEGRRDDRDSRRNQESESRADTASDWNLAKQQKEERWGNKDQPRVQRETREDQEREKPKQQPQQQQPPQQQQQPQTPKQQPQQQAQQQPPPQQQTPKQQPPPQQQTPKQQPQQQQQQPAAEPEEEDDGFTMVKKGRKSRR